MDLVFPSYICCKSYHKVIFVLLVICRYKGVYEYCKSKGIDLGKPVGLDVVVDGTVPQGTIQWLINL
jgi:hypothetical protein